MKLLGESKSVEALDRLSGGLLLTATGFGGDLILSLFDAKGELAAQSMQLSTALQDRFLGLGRYQRTQRIAAAHAVIVVTAFFDTVRDGAQVFGRERLLLLKSEQVLLAGGDTPGGAKLGDLAEQLLRADLPCPGPTQPYERVLEDLDTYYTTLSRRLLEFLRGLRMWESLDESTRERAGRWLEHAVPTQARARYAELFHRLGTEVPEIAYWATRIDHQATRRAIGALDAGLRDLRGLLESVMPGARPGGVRDALSHAYRAALDEPIITISDLPEGIRMPPLGAAYISPCFRLAVMDGSARPAEGRWWNDLPIYDDLRAFLFGYLTHPSATRLPLVVLGQPGAGKSVLTKILAAQLPADQFLAVRVPLREAPADQDLQAQIEHAIRQATGESVRWPALHEAGGNMVAVVILDGFDELLQVTRVSSTNYLEKVATFQVREAAQGRPTAVIVTSRMAVADRARLPRETAVIHLEPFSEHQVERWLARWNEVNAAYFEEHDLLPLRLPALSRLGELATQPLLLLMLALYDMDGNPLRHEDDRLDRADLYEKLLIRFAAREVLKSSRAWSEQALERAIERELMRLSVVAFAMFNRSSQWVTEDELADDLRLLLGEQVRPPTGFRPPLDPGQLIVGRFFFVHESQAVQEDRTRKTYEFLHSTFGEYLLARLTAHEVGELVVDAETHVKRARPFIPADDFLHALLSHSPLSSREPALDFLQKRMRDLAASSPKMLKNTLLGLFRDALQFRNPSDYQAYLPGRVPELRTAPTSFAVYSLNLLILLTLSYDEIHARELFPDPAYAVSRWRSTARLWRSQISYNGWLNLVRALDIHKCWVNGERDLVIRWAGMTSAAPPAVDLYWTYDKPPDENRGHISWMYGDFSSAARQLHFLCGYEEDLLRNALEPLTDELSRSLMTVAGYLPDRAVSPAHALLRMWLLSSGDADPAELAEAYAHCLWLSQAFAPFAERDAVAYLDKVLGHLRLDAPRLRGVLSHRDVQFPENRPETVARIRAVMTELGLT